LHGSGRKSLTLSTGQTKQSLLQDLVLAVPQPEGQTESLVVVPVHKLSVQPFLRITVEEAINDSRNSSNPIFSPSIRPAPRLIKVERVPRISIGRIVLPDRTLYTKTQLF
jgi:hypothetical protein